MEEITLEKIDAIRERTGVSYTEAKEALEESDGNVVDALVYIETLAREKEEEKRGSFTSTKEEFTQWIKEVVRKGNVTKIVVKKDDKVILDVPVNAGVAAGVVIMAALPALFAVIFLTAVVTKVTVEITREDGSVEVVNKIIRNTAENVKDTVSNFKDAAEDAAENVKEKFTGKEETDDKGFQYTVKFDDVYDKKNDEDKKDDQEKTTDK